MVTSLPKKPRRYARKALVFLSLLFAAFAQAQNGNPIPNYTYLGECQGHHYYLSDASLTWSDARDAATGVGGYLATLTSATENSCVTGFVAANIPGGTTGGWGDDNNPWIGYNDYGTENSFVWDNDENCDNFENWLNGEPNNFGEAEDGTQLLLLPGYQGFWNDWFNTETQRFVVEFGPNPCAVTLNLLGVPTIPCTGGSTAQANFEIISNALSFTYSLDGGPQTVPFSNTTFNITGLTAGPHTIVITAANGATFTLNFTVSQDECTGNQGCTLGYWKTHAEDWQVYTPGQTLGSVWTVPVSLGMADNSLMEALDFGGGSGIAGGARTLFRQAVAALLNSAHSDVAYPLLTAQVISQVNTALASNDRNTMLALATQLDTYNNLHGNSLCGDAATSSRMGSRRSSESETIIENAFAVTGYPNPSRGAFSVNIKGLSTEKVSVRVTDVTGRLVELRTNVAPNQVISIGNTYNAGMYYIEVMQGANKQQLKVVKQ